MRSVVGISAMLLLVLNVGLIPAGIIFLKRGLWPQRQGIDPHCRQCGYLLIGITSNVCPECGAMTSPANVIYGQRIRQPRVAAIGALILLLPCTLLTAGLIHGFSTIPWYHFKPTFMVMHDLQSNGVAWQAMNELDRREANGELPSKYEQRLIELGLAQQAGTSTGILTTWAVESVEKQFQAGKLNDAQKRRFFEQSVQLQLSVPVTVQLGKEVQFQTNQKCRVTIPYFYVEIRDWISVSIDDHVVLSGPNGGSGFSGLGGSGSSGGSVPCPQAGNHRLIVVPRIELYQGSGNGGTKVYSQDRPLTASFTVVRANN